VPPLTTDATFLPNGKFVLRTYTSGFLYDAPGKLREELTLPIQPQAESVAYDGKRLLLGSEGPRSKILAVPLPASARGKSTSTPTPSASPTSRPFSFVGDDFGVEAIERALIAMVAASMLVFIVARLRRDR
jgi:hypothetical protein